MGLARALGLPEPKGAAAQAKTLRSVSDTLLTELVEHPWPSREEALALAETLHRAGWAWGPLALQAIRSKPIGRPWRGAGLDVWSRLPEWEETAPLGEPGSKSVSPEAAQARLAELLARAGLDEARPTQSTFAAETAFAFEARERGGRPAPDAGRGGHRRRQDARPISRLPLCGPRANGPSVWVSTYTRALQRQIERESHAVFPDPETCAPARRW